MRRVRRSPATFLILVLCACATACRITPAPSHARPALPHAPPGIHLAEIAIPELLEFLEHGDGRSTGVLVGEGEQVRFEIRRTSAEPMQQASRELAPQSPRPMVLLVPILAGGRELMGLVAQRLNANDFDVAFCERVGSALSPPQRGPELDELFRRTVLHQRLLLKWLRNTGKEPSSLHVLGISMGGIISTVLAAIDRDLASAAICLAGGDLANLVPVSSESRVQNWVAWRQATDGIGIDCLRWELQQFLDYEPARFAAYVPTERVLFVSAALDTVVPRRNQNLDAPNDWTCHLGTTLPPSHSTVSSAPQRPIFAHIPPEWRSIPIARIEAGASTTLARCRAHLFDLYPSFPKHSEIRQNVSSSCHGGATRAGHPSPSPVDARPSSEGTARSGARRPRANAG